MYSNAITVDNILNPTLNNVVNHPAAAGQLRLGLSGTGIDFMQGSTTLSINLISPTTGAVFTGTNIIPNNFNNSFATVDFSISTNDCGYYNLEITNAPTGCGGTTAVIYNSLVGVNISSCTNNALALSTLTVYSPNNNLVPLKPGEEIDGQGTVDDLQVLDDVDLGAEELSVQVFPNPMDQQTNILVKGEELQSLNFVLYDVLGQLVKQRRFEVNETLQLNRENLSAGMYVYRILDATGNPIHVGKLELK